MSARAKPETPSSYVAKARALHLEPVFATNPGFMLCEPTSHIKTHIWRWKDLYPLMLEAGTLLPVGESGSERRVLNLVNPGVTSGLGTSQTLTASIQMVLPTESAPAHRHTAGAIRFIIQGSGGFTTVDGEKCGLSAGDLILTPGWHWHDHSNPGKETLIWLDGLDLPLVERLQATFFENAEGLQPVEDRKEYWADAPSRVIKPMKMAIGNTRELLSYQWATTLEVLDRARESESSPFDDLSFMYANPATGGPVLPTMSCEVQMLRAGTHTRAHRHTSSTIYHVLEGSGYSVINGTKVDWSEHDTLVLPSWSWHEHVNESATDRAILFSLSDWPTMRALGFYREEALSAGFQ